MEESKSKSPVRINNLITPPNPSNSEIILNKIDKLHKKGKIEKLKTYLRNNIEIVRSKYGNKNPLLFELYDNLIQIYKRNADDNFERKDYMNSLEVYLQCYKLSEPLPGSDWTSVDKWYNLRVDILKSLAANYEKLEKIDKAIEHLRIAMNLEDKASSMHFNLNRRGTSDFKYDQLYYLIGNHLMNLENYKESLKYLIKLEKFLESQYNIDKMVSNPEMIVSLTQAKDSILSKYLTVLKMISTAFFKLNRTDEGEKYYEKRVEIVNVIQSQDFKKNFYGMEEFYDEIENENVDVNKDMKRQDKAELEEVERGHGQLRRKITEFKKSNEKSKMEGNVKINSKSKEKPGSISRIDKGNKIKLNPVVNSKITNLKAIPKPKPSKTQTENPNSKSLEKKLNEIMKSNITNKGSKKKLAGIPEDKLGSVIANNSSNKSVSSKIQKAGNHKRVDKSVKGESSREKTKQTRKETSLSKISIDSEDINDNSAIYVKTQESVRKENNMKVLSNLNIPKVNYKKESSSQIPRITTPKKPKHPEPHRSIHRNLQDTIRKIDKDLSQFYKNLNSTSTINYSKRSSSSNVYSEEVDVNDLKMPKIHYPSRLEEMQLDKTPKRSADRNIPSVKIKAKFKEKRPPLLLKLETSKNMGRSSTINEYPAEEISKFNTPQNKQNIGNKTDLPRKDTISEELEKKLNNLEKKKNSVRNSIPNRLTSPVANSSFLPPLQSSTPEKKKLIFTNKDTIATVKKGENIKIEENEEEFNSESQSEREEENIPENIAINNQINNTNQNSLINSDLLQRVREKITNSEPWKEKKIIIHKIIESEYNKIIITYKGVPEEFNRNCFLLETKFVKLGIPNLETIYKIKVNLDLNISHKLMSHKDFTEICNNYLTSQNCSIWPIVLFYFEMWFEHFVKQYKTSLEENYSMNPMDKSEEKKVSYKNFINKLENYLENLKSFSNSKKTNTLQSQLPTTNQTNIAFNINVKEFKIGKSEGVKKFDEYSYLMLVNYFNCIFNLLEKNKKIIGADFILKDISKEEAKRKSKEFYEDVYKYYRKFMNPLCTKLIKVWIFDSYLNDNPKKSSENEADHVLKYSTHEEKLDEFLYDGFILFQGCVKINNKNMFLSLIVRKFENVIRKDKENIMGGTGNRPHPLSEFNFEKLKFLSTNEEIIKIYEYLEKDLNRKFYGKTKYTSFVQFHLSDFSSASNWFDNVYIRWETLLNFFKNFEKNGKNVKFFNFDYILNNQHLYSLAFEFLSYYFHNFISIRDGNLDVESFENFLEDKLSEISSTHKENIDVMMFRLLERFEYYYYNKYHQKEVIKFREKNFFDLYLSKPNEDYLENYINKEMLTKSNQMDHNHSSLEDENLKIVQNVNNNSRSKSSHIYKASPDEFPDKINFFDEIKINNNKYRVMITSLVEKLELSPGELKNLNIPDEYKMKMQIKLKPVLRDNWYHYILTSSSIIKTFLDIFNNCDNNKNYNTHIKNLINLEEENIGQILKIGLKNKLLAQKKIISQNTNFNILKKIAFLCDCKDFVELNDEKIKRLKILTITVFLRDSFSKNSKYLFSFKFFTSIKLKIERPKIKNERLIEINETMEVEKKYSNNVYGNFFLQKKNFRGINKFSKNPNANLQETYKISEIKSLIAFINIYNPTTSNNFFFILSVKDLAEFFEKVHNKKLNKKFFGSDLEENNQQSIVNSIPKKVKIVEELTGYKVFLKYTTVKKLNKRKKENEKELLNVIIEDYSNVGVKKEYLGLRRNQAEKTKNSKWLATQVFLKPKFDNLLIKDNLYDIHTNEMKLILKTAKYYKITKKDKDFLCVISIYYHRILEYWTILFIFPHNQRKFSVNIHPSDIANIPKESYKDLNVVETGLGVTETQIWKYFIKHSHIQCNTEGNAIFEIFNIRTIMRELLHYGYEIISDTDKETNLEKNQIIYVEITIKTRSRFLLAEIHETLPSVEMETANVILQAFSFEEFSWHKEIFKLDDFADYIKDKITFDDTQVRIPQLKQIPLIGVETSDLRSKLPKDDNISQEGNVRKLVKYCHLNKLAIFIIKSYRRSKQLVFEDQLKYNENKGVSGTGDNTISKIIENIKQDRAQRKNLTNIFNRRLENMSSEKVIYTETLSSQPYIIANVVLNLNKQHVIISFYHPKQTGYNHLTVDFQSIRESFFPYFNDIMSSDFKALGRRVMNYYRMMIISSPVFMKFVKNLNETLKNK